LEYQEKLGLYGKMKSLYEILLEGGAAGHMAHPYDYTEFTLREMKGLIRNLLSGKIEDVTEKVDGMNIVATMNTKGEVVFIRNKGDLNSEQGGMTVSDMAMKWADRPEVAKTYTSAGETITKVFQQIGQKFFNPDENTRIAANCECVIAGKTNIMLYASAQVDFHNLFVYTKTEKGWEQTDTTKQGLDKIQAACEKIDGAQITPQLIIKTTEETNNMIVSFIKEIDKIFKEAKCKEMDTIEDWKWNRFVDYCKEGCEWTDWVLKSDEGAKLLFKRWFDADKSVNIKKIKELYPEDANKVSAVDKSGEYKKWVGDVMEPLDTFFARFGNTVISLCDGIINSGMETKIVTQLKNDMNDVTNAIQQNGSVEANEKLSRQLNRLAKLGDNINPVEGIVFNYKGKLMKATGSFAALNQLMGLRWSI